MGKVLAFGQARSGPAVTTELSPWSVAIRATRCRGEAVPSVPEALVEQAKRLNIEFCFNDVGYEASFAFVAHDLGDATTTAQRRWFYLATDLDVPAWRVTDIVVAPLHQ